MLLKLGPVTFEIAPFNVTEYDHSHEARFVEKPVLGVRPPLEYVGDGGESWRITGKLFPAKFGGLDGLQKLYQARASGKPQYFARGDGKAMGWVVIDKISERSSHLDPQGIGQVIEVDITVKATSKPGNSSFFSIMSAVSSQVVRGFTASSMIGR